MWVESAEPSFSFSIPGLFEIGERLAVDFHRRGVFTAFDEAGNKRGPMSLDAVLDRVKRQLGFAFQTYGAGRKDKKDPKTGLVFLRNDQPRIFANFISSGAMLELLNTGVGCVYDALSPGKMVTRDEVTEVTPDLRYLDLSGRDLTAFRVFRSVDLHKAILDRARVARMTWLDTKANHASMVGLQAEGLVVAGRDAEGRPTSVLRNAVLRGADLRNSALLGDLRRIDLLGADLEGSSLQESRLDGATVSVAQLTERLDALHKAGRLTASQREQALADARGWSDANLAQVVCDDRVRAQWSRFTKA